MRLGPSRLPLRRPRVGLQPDKLRIAVASFTGAALARRVCPAPAVVWLVGVNRGGPNGAGRLQVGASRDQRNGGQARAAARSDKQSFHVRFNIVFYKTRKDYTSGRRTAVHCHGTAGRGTV
jgi:hypothetical protein